MRLEKSKFSSFLLHLLMPGLGHIFWKEYVFGLFVFLIVLIGMILFLVSFFMDISTLLIFGMLSLPVLFYFFSFLDLSNTINSKTKIVHQTRKAMFLYIAIGVVYQVAAPVTPLNFIIRNFPEYFIVEKNNLSPLFLQGDVLKTDKLAYIVNLFFVEKPLLKNIPQRYDIIRFKNSHNTKQVGIVIGLPNEEVEMLDGILLINGNPEVSLPPGGISLMGEIDLTKVNEYSILVATLNLGTLDKIYEVSFEHIIGKVDKLF